MTGPDPNDAQKKLFAEAVADGLTIFESRKAEEQAKEAASKSSEGDGKNGGSDGDKVPAKRTLAEWLLG